MINSDKLYLEKILEIKISEITNWVKKPYQKTPKKDMSVFLNASLIKCTTCDKEIKLDEKAIRYQNFWHHESCNKINSKHEKRKIQSVEYKKIKPKTNRRTNR